MTTIVVFGGSGFLGRRLVQLLVSQGTTVHIAVRHPERAQNIFRQVSSDRIRVFHADVRSQASINAVLAGADAVVNAVSAYVETGNATFHAVHVQGAQTVAREAAAASVARLVLVSGLGANSQSSSPYIRARGRGELLVQQVFQGATIVRPSAMFGPGDLLFSKIAALSRVLPVLPLIGDGQTRLEPVYVGDVAEAIRHVLDLPETAGQIYELAGPQVYTLEELANMTLRLIGRRRLLVPIPFAFAEILARLFEILPSPPLTTSQVDLLKAENVVSGKMPGFRELSIEPKSVERIVPTYVGRTETPSSD
jgi:NADH dehydrogenase